MTRLASKTRIVVGRHAVSASTAFRIRQTPWHVRHKTERQAAFEHRIGRCTALPRITAVALAQRRSGPGWRECSRVCGVCQRGSEL